ncbi:hypothetical protein ACFXKX_05440 [Streptomyces scopuliridis]|uniref:hypothetical protein n=1 Tax=Streptomyces scopuliridis TaxID=452529 RepID=UPI0036B330C7
MGARLQRLRRRPLRLGHPWSAFGPHTTRPHPVTYRPLPDAPPLQVFPVRREGAGHPAIPHLAALAHELASEA